MTDHTPLPPDQLGAYLVLSEVSSLIEHAVEQQLRDAGLTVPQFQILARLSGAPATQLRMTDLADGLVYSRSGLTYQAGQLEKAGLVTRTPGAVDERSVTVTLTPAGRAALDRAMPGHVEVVRRLLLDALTPDDVAAIADILGRVRDRMRAAPPRSAAARPPRRRR
ncbi:MarR family winged helix-turn-helix transcriptional regulator [Paractinoplanes rhizophilus]|uniref:MarR family winged helix-turn-helix transcriptional regulator n=1 Tax=Paractinoplanes rhizophilus TaxID=1416877 RepID=A0ABW2HPC1_9ACTN|nr:MarR family transcriptional regulator [Actinoplanes sp.]